jgi:phosphatidylglycerophosphatase A
MIIGFIIFRIFDILKPLGINRLQKLPGGIGIVADDIVAAIYSNITLKALGVCLSCL